MFSVPQRSRPCPSGWTGGLHQRTERPSWRNHSAAPCCSFLGHPAATKSETTCIVKLGIHSTHITVCLLRNTTGALNKTYTSNKHPQNKKWIYNIAYTCWSLAWASKFLYEGLTQISTVQHRSITEVSPLSGNELPGHPLHQLLCSFSLGKQFSSNEVSCCWAQRLWWVSLGRGATWIWY